MILSQMESPINGLLTFRYLGACAVACKWVHTSAYIAPGVIDEIANATISSLASDCNAP